MKRLKELRRQQERTQADLARLLGVNRTAISKLELGQQQASAAQLLKLSKYFNVSIDFLLGCENLNDSDESFDLMKILECDRLFIGNHRLSAAEKKMLKGVVKAILWKYA